MAAVVKCVFDGARATWGGKHESRPGGWPESGQRPVVTEYAGLARIRGSGEGE